MEENLLARCKEHCNYSIADDPAVVSACKNFHTEDDHFEKTGEFCVKAAATSNCEVCAQYLIIMNELDAGITPERICHECYHVFELNSTNPYGDVLYDEGLGAVYFECDECTALECNINDIEDEIDRMAELMEMGRI